MSQVMVNFRMDSELKRAMETVCDELGMSLTTAFTIYARKLTRERRIPFEVSVDPFWSEANLAHLHRGLEQLEAHNGQTHELLEDVE
ncbi:MAG: type II toxin-antitoxin system RelB/DinJ family antitoxin [Oscillospiraceae bacterium]|nr:type II toxin-antitoxin system RelB/DinJ family antitoxin [Oscillospiraceae bacterium]